MSKKIINTAEVVLLVGMISGFIILYFIQLKNYLLFHSLIELFSIVIAFCIFIIVWNGRKYLKHSYLLLIGLAYLFIGFIDLLHVLGYNGMNIFKNYDYYANQFWIAARGIEAATLLAGAFLIGNKRELPIIRIIILYFIVTSLLIYSIIFSDIFPLCFIAGEGQTMFKIVSEYIINIVLLFTIFITFRKRSFLAPDIFHLIILSIFFTIVAELSFTFYISNYGISNMIGHYAKLLSFYFIYRAVVRKSLMEPYNSIFRELSEQKNALAKTNELKNSLFAIISHDLTGLVSAVAVVAQTLESDFNEMTAELRREYISQLRISADNTSDLIDNLLAWSRIELGGHQSRKDIYSISSIIEEPVRMMKPVFQQKGVDLSLQINYSESADLYIDRDLFLITVRNILSNSLKFSQPGTCVQILLSREKGNVLMEIKDQGVGMDFNPEILKNSVNKSTRGTRNEKGSGLGLYMINRYTIENGGELKITSTPGEGTSVCLIFPVILE